MNLEYIHVRIIPGKLAHEHEMKTHTKRPLVHHGAVGYAPNELGCIVPEGACQECNS